MGYTNYWTLGATDDAEAFARATLDCKRVCEAIKAPIVAGLNPNDEAVFSSTAVELNGIMDDAHEPLIVRKDEPGWAFCKTAAKPYDLAVQCCLIALNHHLGEGFRVSSDGTKDEWRQARETCDDVLGYGIGFEFKE